MSSSSHYGSARRDIRGIGDGLAVDSCDREPAAEDVLWLTQSDGRLEMPESLGVMVDVDTRIEASLLGHQSEVADLVAQLDVGRFHSRYHSGNLVMVVVDTPVDGIGHSRTELIEVGILRPKSVDEKSSSGSRSLDTGVRHHVEYGIVAFVTNSHNHRQREIGDIDSKVVAVEAVEVGSATTTANDDHQVEEILMAVYTVESSDDRLFGSSTLHGSSEEVSIEADTIVVVAELVAEVAISGSILCAHDSDALGQERDVDLLVHVDDALIVQPLDDLLPTQSQFAQSEARVDIDNVEREPISLVHLHHHAHQNLHSGREPLASHRLERLPAQHPSVAPYRSPCPCHDGIAARRILDEFEIAVPIGCRPDLRDLSHHPIMVIEGRIDHLRNAPVQFVKTYLVAQSTR